MTTIKVIVFIFNKILFFYKEYDFGTYFLKFIFILYEMNLVIRYFFVLTCILIISDGILVLVYMTLKFL